MMGRRHQIFLALLLTSVLCSCSACGKSKIPVSTEEPSSQTESEISSETTSWEWKADLVPVEGHDGLYRLSSSVLKDRDFTEIAQIGDDLLLVRETWSYAAGSAESDDGNDLAEGSVTSAEYDYGEEDYGEEDYGADEEGWAEEEISCSYLFQLYDPAEDRITAELSEFDYDPGSWQVLDNHLYVTDPANSILYRYDDTLSPEETIDYSSAADFLDLDLYSANGDIGYSMDYQNSQVLKVNLEDLSCTSVSKGYFNAYPCAVSPDGHYLCYSGIDRTTLRQTVVCYDTIREEPVLTFESSDSYVEAVTDEGVVFTYNYSAGNWAEISPSSEDDISAGTGSFCFRAEGLSHLIPLSDGTLLALQDTYGDDTSSHTAGWTLLDQDLQLLSDFSYNCIGDDDQDSYFSTHVVFFPENGCRVFLTIPYDADSSSSSLLIWKAEESPSAAEEGLLLEAVTSDAYAEQDGLLVDRYGNVISAVTDPDSYDWGELSDCRRKAAEMSEAYGMEIYIGPQIPESIDCYTTTQETDPALVMDALERLDRILSCYPEGFFDQLCCGSVKGIRIYLTGDLYGSTAGMIDDPGGYVCDAGDDKSVVLDTTFSYDWDYTIDHELSHLITSRLELWSAYDPDASYSDETWMTYLPADFDYLYTYDNYEDSAGYAEYPDLFRDSYGTTWLTEDAAELFGYAMELGIEDGTDWMGLLTDDNCARGRYAYYCTCIRYCFNTTGWEDVTLWEKILHQD